METKTIALYTFDELSERAKDVARNWFLEGATQFDSAWEQIREDAKNIGLIISSLSQYRANDGHFNKYAEDCARRIVKEHGPDCATRKTAKSFLEGREEILKTYPEDESGYRDLAGDDAIEELEKKFRHDILEDYRSMLEQEIEHQTSQEVVDENIRANEYTFRENGERED